MKKYLKTITSTLLVCLISSFLLSCNQELVTSTSGDDKDNISPIIYYDGNLSLPRQYIMLYEGETYPLKVYVNESKKDELINVIPKNTDIVSIDKNACLVAKKPGETSINFSCDDETIDLYIYVCSESEKQFWNSHQFQPTIYNNSSGGFQVNDMVYLGASYYGSYDLIYDEYTVWKNYVTYNPIKGEDLIKQIDRTTFQVLAPGQVTFQASLRDDLKSAINCDITINEFKTYPSIIQEEINLKLIPNANVFTKINMYGNDNIVPSMLTFDYEVTPKKYEEYVYLERIEGVQLINSYFDNKNHYHYVFGDDYMPSEIFAIENSAIGYDKISFQLKLKDASNNIYVSNIVDTFWTNCGSTYTNPCDNLTLNLLDTNINVNEIVEIQFDVQGKNNNNFLKLVCLEDNEAFEIIYNNIKPLKIGTFTIKGFIYNPFKDEIEAESLPIIINVS